MKFYWVWFRLGCSLLNVVLLVFHILTSEYERPCAKDMPGAPSSILAKSNRVAVWASPHELPSYWRRSLATPLPFMLNLLSAQDMEHLFGQHFWFFTRVNENNYTISDQGNVHCGGGNLPDFYNRLLLL